LKVQPQEVDTEVRLGKIVSKVVECENGPKKAQAPVVRVEIRFL
jgi:hypothetical protein